MTENQRLQLLPAVDVADGQAVRLVQGEAGSETGYGDPVEAALAWQEAGAEWVHLVDLDAAFGQGGGEGVRQRIFRRRDIVAARREDRDQPAKAAARDILRNARRRHMHIYAYQSGRTSTQP